MMKKKKSELLDYEWLRRGSPRVSIDSHIDSTDDANHKRLRKTLRAAILYPIELRRANAIGRWGRPVAIAFVAGHAFAVAHHQAIPSPPKMIFLDAAGTLIEVRGSVGEIYSRIALSYGIQRRPEELQDAFRRCFPAQPPMAFSPEISMSERKRLEFHWWRSLVCDVFDEAGLSAGFDDCFHELFAFFGTPDAWRIFPDVAPALNRLKECGIKFAIISNFDSRLDNLLDALGLTDYLEAVHISTRIGAAKPDPQIFRAALLHHGVAPEAAWHVGDSLREDAEAALGAGMQGIWLDRENVGAGRLCPARIRGLNQLIDLIRGR